VTIYISNGWGDSEKQPTPATMRRFLEALDPNDEEHGAAWVSDEEDNSLEWNVDGRLVYSSATSSRHMLKVSKDKVMPFGLRSPLVALMRSRRSSGLQTRSLR
jgi:hypothetical protein